MVFVPVKHLRLLASLTVRKGPVRSAVVPQETGAQRLDTLSWLVGLLGPLFCTSVSTVFEPRVHANVREITASSC